ncbi:N(4)-(beta-N-acetylglucosaminyl)-L-asparaginase [Francisella tularensis]|uniref:N(4)-(beta-N-acetylglucosaminyl)-L-asparaginase n=1 Tax=Francisella tularensis TaxID=263 RepID=UPI000173E2A7|nr:N(4)-(beta-N-acetylglucosaminyl)-L-asparaginase [Francisella tularensis]ACD31241.1 asparaginase [Francisella tularensis subsp. mediasiatica FSC147]MBK2077967.1 N(4)-(beta-N-acetylglucosaminyl)-L-asparaginase [Francisella tularensis subsp. mediasiatica]MBK2101858.1 N(4)-(beta-N-acetylglucosaminyl)-L-asparaginase [Francisella tularensis subsp. mediasiatica]MBK2105323.1 N(4)-(beta-N-acetylglucosaminyl)-L-asparaginase [Francisella tularensis subsp. mediasiatica]MDN9003738.1 N(4)-(beta-N-acetylg
MILIANDEGCGGVPEAFKRLKNKENGLRAIIEGIKLVENDTTIKTVGRGSWPDILGNVTLDASVMDGDDLRTGSIGALKGYANPVEVAYEVMQRLYHEILVAEGANRFANEINATKIDNLLPEIEKAWQEHLDKHLSAEQRTKFPNIPLIELSKHSLDPEEVFDTTVYLSKDHNNTISSATSTSGWAWRYPGRLGDSPIIGAGSYADSRYGACACTHTGEMAIRCSTARSVVLYMKMGMSVKDAVLEAVKDLRHLKTGYLDELTIHAIDNQDNHYVASFKGSEPVFYWIWTDDMLEPIKKQARLIL